MHHFSPNRHLAEVRKVHINDVAKSARRCNCARNMRRCSVAKIRAIHRHYISGSDLCSFFRRFLSLSGEKERETEEVNSSEHSRERQDISPPSFPLTQARSDSVRNVIERLSLSERAIKLRLLLESELLVASVPKGIPWTLVYTIEHFFREHTDR